MIEDELKNLYEETFGKKPSGRAKRETVIEKLEKEGIDVSAFTVEEEEQEKPPVKEETKPKSKSTDLPVIQGSGRNARHLVYFRGNARYWTENSIRAMRTYAKDIKFPENTEFTEANNFSKCKTCG